MIGNKLNRESIITFGQRATQVTAETSSLNRPNLECAVIAAYQRPVPAAAEAWMTSRMMSDERDSDFLKYTHLFHQNLAAIIATMPILQLELQVWCKNLRPKSVNHLYSP